MGLWQSMAFTINKRKSTGSSGQYVSMGFGKILVRHSTNIQNEISSTELVIYIY